MPRLQTALTTLEGGVLNHCNREGRGSLAYATFRQDGPAWSLPGEEGGSGGTGGRARLRVCRVQRRWQSRVRRFRHR
ncbi:MAG: hypothetical protein QGH70_07205 [Nitrospinota bacterium]|nr:hypothetical protein [Nitrospinota bacterium]